MASNPPQPDPPPRSVHQLGYAAPAPASGRPTGGIPQVGQIGLGVAAFIGAGSLGALSGAAFDAVGVENTGGIGMSVFVLSLILAAAYVHTHCRWRGFLVGILIGVVLAFIAMGIFSDIVT